MGGIGCFMVSFVLVVEHVGFKLTALFGVAIEIPFALGQAVLGIEAYIFRDWRILQIVSHLPLIGQVQSGPASHLTLLCESGREGGRESRGDLEKGQHIFVKFS